MHVLVGPHFDRYVVMDSGNIVVGIDFSEEAERALKHAIAIGRRKDKEVVLVHSLALSTYPLQGPPMEPGMIPEAFADRATEILESAKARLTKLREANSGLGASLSQTYIDQIPQQGINEAANEMKAGLIVMGSHGRTGLTRFLLGSVAEQVARHAKQDVLVARGDAPDGGYQKILVATDFSKTSELALEKVAALAESGAEVILLHVWETPGSAIADWGSARAQLREIIQNSVKSSGEKLLKRFEGSDLKVTLMDREGSPRATIVDAAEELGADLIVMGSHGRTGIGRILLGSVAEATIRHAKTSVFIARAKS